MHELANRFLFVGQNAMLHAIDYFMAKSFKHKAVNAHQVNFFIVVGI